MRPTKFKLWHIGCTHTYRYSLISYISRLFQKFSYAKRQRVESASITALELCENTAQTSFFSPGSAAGAAALKYIYCMFQNNYAIVYSSICSIITKTDNKHHKARKHIAASASVVSCTQQSLQIWKRNYPKETIQNNELIDIDTSDTGSFEKCRFAKGVSLNSYPLNQLTNSSLPSGKLT